VEGGKIRRRLLDLQCKEMTGRGEEVALGREAVPLLVVA
jgi:hypothetical protein